MNPCILPSVQYDIPMTMGMGNDSDMLDVYPRPRLKLPGPGTLNVCVLAGWPVVDVRHVGTMCCSYTINGDGALLA